MRDGDRLSRCLDRIEGRPVTAMRHVHEHPDIIHRLDDVAAEVAQAPVLALGAAAADEILTVIGELSAAQPELMESLHVLALAELVCVLDPHDDCDFPGTLGLIEIGGLADEREETGIAPGKTLPGCQK